VRFVSLDYEGYAATGTLNYIMNTADGEARAARPAA